MNNIDLNIIWNALHNYQTDSLSGCEEPEGDKYNEEAWDEICTQMAWIHEALGIDYDEPIEE